MHNLTDVVRAPRGWILPALVIGACLVTGVAIAVMPAVGAGVGIAVFGGILAVALPGAASRTFLAALVLILLGYAFMGRGFAYIGVAPVFIGEVVLGLGLLALVLDGRRFVTFRAPLTWVLVIFMLWGVATTLPYFPTYGVMSLRDAVLWGYGILVLALVPALVRNNTLERVPALYSKILPIYVAWVPVAVFIEQFLVESIPFVPGTQVPFIDIKPGDLNVHLAGVAAFLLLGVAEKPDENRRSLAGIALTRGLLWAVWLVGFAMAGVLNRGGMLAVFAAVGVVFALRPVAVVRRLVMLAIMTFVIVSGLLLSNLELALSDRRPLSVEQIAANVTSIFVSDGQRDGTKEWRLLWWGEIVDYTVFGPYRWTGKGYGINLADADGFQVIGESALRSPHNGHMTILARGGVPGLLLWMAVQFGFAFMMLRNYTRSRSIGDEPMARLSVWLLAYWAAFMINGAFDVFLEGPQGGIWMWAVMGMGVAASIVARNREHQRMLEPAR